MSGQQRLSLTGAVATAAATLSLHTVFAGGAWFFPIIGCIALVFATTSAARGARLPSVLHPVLAAAVVLLWITFLDARHVAIAGFIPGPGALRVLGQVTRNGFTDVHRLATPVPTHRGVVLLAVVGIAAMSLVIDLLVVQFRRCALAGLPLLGLFTTCAAVGHHGAGIFAFVVSAAAFLWLLFVDSQEQVTRWGTSVTGDESRRRRSLWSESRPDPAAGSTATALGRRIGGAAIGLGVVVPLIIPGLHTGIDRHTIGTGTGDGSSSIHTVNPIVSVGSDLNSTTAVPVITYRTNAANPGYLRLTSLDKFDGQGFSASPLQAPPNSHVDGRLPGVTPPAPTPADPVVTTSVSVSPTLEAHWLPVDSEPASVKVGGDWLYDSLSGTIFSARDDTRGVKYTTTSVALQPTAAQLSATVPPGPALNEDLSLPATLSPAVTKLTKRVAGKAKTSYQVALAIQNYLAGGNRFVYDTSAKASTGPDPLANFLLRSKRGFCQQFSTAMAVMARIMGIPSRVAVGFTRGTKRPDGSWLVTTHDAHAWPELYFQGVGWVPFEPTPRGDGQAVTPAYATPGGANTGNDPTQKSANNKPNGTDIPNKGLPGGLRHNAAGGAGGSATLTAATHHSSTKSMLVELVLLLIALALVLPGSLRLVWRWSRRYRMRTPARAAEAAWEELRGVALDLHAPWDEMFSPRQAAAAVARVMPKDRELSEALGRVALAEERARYARDPGPAGPELWADVDRVARALRNRLEPMQRLRYRVFPRSVLLTIRPVFGRAADVLDGADTWMARSRRLLRLHPRAGSASA
jgi:transglutaminase-like putative cysteine protease